MYTWSVVASVSLNPLVFSDLPNTNFELLETADTSSNFTPDMDTIMCVTDELCTLYVPVERLRTSWLSVLDDVPSGPYSVVLRM